MGSWLSCVTVACPIATLSCDGGASIDQWIVQGGFDSGFQTRSAVNKAP